MNRIKNIVFPILFLIISVAVLCFSFIKIGLLPSIDIEFFTEITNVEKPIKDNNQLIDELKRAYLTNERDLSLPNNLNAIWLNLNKDLIASSESSTNDVKYEIYSSFDYFRNFVPNAIFLKPDTESEFSHLLEPDGSSFDIFAYTLFYAKTIDLFRFLVIDDDLIYNDKGEFSNQELDYYLTKYDIDGVLLSADSLYSEQAYYDAVKFFSTHLRNNYTDIYFGCEIHTDVDALFADEYVIRVFEDKLVDYGYVDCKTSTLDTVYPFSTVALWWNSFADYYNVPFYCEHRADLIFSDEVLWGLSTEINLQLKVLYNCPSFTGSCYYRAGYLKSNKALARDLSILLNDVTSASQDTFSIDNLSIDKNRIYFSGSAMSDLVNIYCNDIRIVQKDGLFEKSYVMQPGLNTYHFFSNFGEYTYKVYNNTPLIESCYPNDDLIIKRNDSKIESYAVCPEGSMVFAIFDGGIYEMKIASQNSADNMPEGYCKYVTDIGLSGRDYNGVELSYLCIYDNDYYAFSPCLVFSDVNNGNHQTTTVKELTPYSDNGLGKSLMCMIDFDNAEQISSLGDYDTYHPYKSPLVKGTIDYIKNINVSEGGYLRYELESGINVYGVDCILISNGYRMPLNKLVLKSCDDSKETETRLTFSMDWLSPVTVTVKNPEYKVGYESFSFNIDSYNSSSVDITFKYTESVDIGSGIIFSENSVFSSYEIIRGDADDYILRLYLKKNGAFYGYQLHTNDSDELELSFKKRVSSDISGKVILLDPGHGGMSMVGTAIMDNSVSEAQVTLAIANRAKYYLEQYGAKVIMTRVMDSSLTLSERTDICERENPDVFVSIHCDGVDNVAESGTHTFYFNAYSHALANNIHNRMVNTYVNNIYVEADDNFTKVDRKIKYYPFYVTRVATCPSVLVECGFMSNYVEGYVLANPVNQDYLGHAIADGIVDYFLNS